MSSSLSSRNANSPFVLVHSGVWRTPIASNFDYRYYILFLDDYTKFFWIYLMREKFESFKKFKEFHAMVKNIFHTSISYFQSDGGGECVNQKFKSFFQQNDIIYRFSCPHTSAQNGRAERKHRHIANVLCCLIFQASMSFKYWGDACLYVVFLINVTPLLVLNYKSPFELFYGHIHDYDLICVF
ncbi:hypothetical protein RDI58_007815 [Solanum bulbocastanum]|uniref:Integrase catalytic domain-containing protein n=1 Tax=Solanum bulbocastanum TaxID=147425 RepID=A0AAN8U277_SOLBU